MAEDRSSQAWDRIEAALARIEAAAARPRATNGDPDLARRHQRLRSEVSASLAALDALIEGSAR